MSPFITALLQDLTFISVFIGLGVYIAKKRNRSVFWGLIGPTVIGLVVILLLPKNVEADVETMPSPDAS